jgi:excisionase family DNA binding protein
MLSENLYTVREAAEQTRLAYWTVWDLLKKGRLIRTKVAGKTFIRESELRKLFVDKVSPQPAARKPEKSRKVRKREVSPQAV